MIPNIELDQLEPLQAVCFQLSIERLAARLEHHTAHVAAVNYRGIDCPGDTRVVIEIQCGALRRSFLLFGLMPPEQELSGCPEAELDKRATKFAVGLLDVLKYRVGDWVLGQPPWRLGG